jgi:cupin fold WbuC family metalloprotein
MSAPLIVDQALLDHLAREAGSSARGRKNLNFHTDPAAPCQRLLNALEPGTYVRPHRHLDPAKDEALVILRGRIGILFFDNAGRVTETALLDARGDIIAIDIPHGAFHSVVALASGSVVFEAKAGPYVAQTPEEWAPFGPAEGSEDCARYRTWMESFFPSGKD